METATRIHELPLEDVARLLVKAAIRLRLIRQAGVNLEHIPVHAYHLLRQVSQEDFRVATLHARDDLAALEFLLSRQLVQLSPDGSRVAITAAGHELGEIAAETKQ